MPFLRVKCGQYTTDFNESAHVLEVTEWIKEKECSTAQVEVITPVLRKGKADRIRPTVSKNRYLGVEE